MSMWTYIHGTITVDVPGTTQEQMQYVASTILAHLPRVTGSEGDMEIYLIQKQGYNGSSNYDEFGDQTNNLKDYYGCKRFSGGLLETQSRYLIIVDGALRDKSFGITFREFMKWANRMAKRLFVCNMLVKIEGNCGEEFLLTDAEPYKNMYEDPSWIRDEPTGKPAWWEYLLWQNYTEKEDPHDAGTI